jgi:glycerophosphoryl diester phosphodiesterase
VTEPRTLLLAHRGDHRTLTENSLDALVAATDIPGCDGVELDIRASSDGVPVVVHDPTLSRVQHRREAVADLTAAELESLGVPRLEGVLRALPRRAFLDVELKESFGREIVEILAAGRGPELNHAVLSSFDPEVIARIRALVPGWPWWLNARDLSAVTIATATELGCVGVSAEVGAVGARTVRAARAAGLQVAAWTVTRRSTFRRLVELGVVAVCVDGEALTG